MSFKAFVWAWEAPVEKAEHLLVLLALADIANDAGQVRAGAPYIARKCRKEERAIRRALIAMNGVAISIMERPGKVPLITLLIPDEFVVRFAKDQEQEIGRRGRPRKPLATMEISPPHHGVNPSAIVPDEPILEPMKRTSEVVLVNAPARPFDIWWKHYPLKKAKDAAIVAFEKAMRRIEDPDPLQVLIDGADRYVEEIARTGVLVKHPATWLNAGCWNDEPDATNRSQTDGQPFGSTAPGARPDRGREQHAERTRAMLSGAMEAVNRRRRWGLGD